MPMLHRAQPQAELKLGLKHKIRLSNPERPLVFFVHGRAGNIDVMAPFKRSAPDSFNLIFVEAPKADPIGGFSWWLIDSTQTESEIEKAATNLKEFIDACLSYYQLKPKCRLALGFSQGAGLLSLLVQKEPQLFDGVAMLAGFVLKKQQALACPARADAAKIFIAHGLQDKTVPIEQARAGAEHLKSFGFKVEMVEDNVAHKIGVQGTRQLRAWLHEFNLPSDSR